MEEGWIMALVHLECKSNLLLSSFHLFLLFSDQQILGIFDHAKLFWYGNILSHQWVWMNCEFQSPVP